MGEQMEQFFFKWKCTKIHLKVSSRQEWTFRYIQMHQNISKSMFSAFQAYLIQASISIAELSLHRIFCLLFRQISCLNKLNGLSNVLDHLSTFIASYHQLISFWTPLLKKECFLSIQFLILNHILAQFLSLSSWVRSEEYHPAHLYGRPGLNSGIFLSCISILGSLREIISKHNGEKNVWIPLT